MNADEKRGAKAAEAAWPQRAEGSDTGARVQTQARAHTRPTRTQRHTQGGGEGSRRQRGRKEH